MSNCVAKLEDASNWIVYQSVTAACFTPIFGSRLAAEMFATYYRGLPIGAPEWEDAKQIRSAADFTAYIEDAFGADPDEKDPGLPAWMIVSLAENFIDNDNEIPFSSYQDLVDACSTRECPIPTLLDNFRQWRERTHLRFSPEGRA
jgi:hypothetical protein